MYSNYKSNSKDSYSIGRFFELPNLPGMGSRQYVKPIDITRLLKSDKDYKIDPRQFTKESERYTQNALRYSNSASYQRPAPYSNQYRQAA